MGWLSFFIKWLIIRSDRNQRRAESERRYQQRSREIESSRAAYLDARDNQSNRWQKEKERSWATIFHFGKYKGEKIEDVFLNDRSYVEWLLKQSWFDKYANTKTACLRLQQGLPALDE